MKDKEKQIEEMAKDIEHQKMFGPCIFENCPFREDDEILCNNCKVAQYLYNKHYLPKLPKDSVVLSREEYREYVDNENEAYYRGQHETEVYYKNIQIPRERKETAERDFNAVIKALETKKTSILTHYGIKESVGADIAIRTVKELAKQFGVEIKE